LTAAGRRDTLRIGLGERTMRFGHMGLMVRDLARMRDFYTRVLGFTETDDGPAGAGNYMVFLCTEPRDHHQIFLCQTDDLSPASRIHHLAFRVDDLPELRRIAQRLEGEVRFMEPANHGIAWSIYTEDPEGNSLEFFVETPWFIHQPMKRPLDFSLSDEEIVRTSEAFCRSMPGFTPHPEWYGRLRKQMGVE
jgi:catechol 2,3-dioxygenase-like lactoylglutathione lyase family enzyme